MRFSIYLFILLLISCNSYHKTFNKRRKELDNYYAKIVKPTDYLNGNIYLLNKRGDIITVEAVNGYILPFTLKQFNKDSIIIFWEGFCYNQEKPITYNEIYRTYSFPLDKDIYSELFEFSYFKNGTKKRVKYYTDSINITTFIQPSIEIEYRRNKTRKKVKISGLKTDTIIQFNYKGEIDRMKVIQKENKKITTLPTCFYSKYHFDSLEINLQARIEKIIKKPCKKIYFSPVLNPAGPPK